MLELYTVIFIFAILLGIALPEYNRVLMKEERELTLERLEFAIEFAKQEAYHRNKTISICATLDHQNCYVGSWTQGFIVYETDFSIPQSPFIQILRSYPKLQYGTLNFDHFGQHLQFEANGRTHNVGTFTYCPKDKNLGRKEAQALIVNKAGRTYRPIKRNILGIYEKHEGTPRAEPLTCR